MEIKNLEKLLSEMSLEEKVGQMIQVPAKLLTKGGLLTGPTEAMEILVSDTASMITPEQQKKLDEYKKKAADIFRRRYEKEAQQVLTGVYSRKYKNTSNQNFVEINQAAIEELIKKQTDIAAQTGIDPNTSQKIAQEVIDKVSTQLQNMQNNK